MTVLRRICAVAVLAGLVACAPSAAMHAIPAAQSASRLRDERGAAQPSDRLKHIIVIVQENRSVDNLFNGFCVPSGPCANTVLADPSSGRALVPESMKAPFSPYHSHEEFVAEFDYGKMDGFAGAPTICNDKKLKTCPYTALSYVPASETQIYRDLATVDGVLSDATFETVQGPSFPAHLYAIAGQSGGYDKDHEAIIGGSGSCGTKNVVRQIDMSSEYPGTFGPSVLPCKNFRTIFDLLEHKGHTWRYYSNDVGGFFSAPQAIQHLYQSANFIVPSTQFLTDIAGGQLADVTFIMPWSHAVSDHPGNVKNPKAGPEWVASLVNAVGQSPYWKSSAVVIWWDDWGGWFDHVAPPAAPAAPDPLEYGFRVPLLVISPYARLGTIDHTQRTFVSALRLIEETFHAGTLKTTDKDEPDGLDSMFDFNQKPFAFTPVGAGFMARPPSTRR